MKHNEAIYRSPKWLRNFVDYEINTGDDIKGAPSKRKLKQLEKEKAEQLLLDWDKRWNSIDEATFRAFFKETYDFDIRYDALLQQVRKQFRGDFNLWKMYDAYLAKEKKEEERQKELRNEINAIHDEVRADFMRYPYSDKITTPRINGKNAFHYEMENGYTFKLEDNKISYKGTTYTVSNFFRNKFVDLANMMIKSQKSRPTWDKKQKRSAGGGAAGSSSSGSSWSGAGTGSKKYGRPAWADHPKAETYRSLQKSIELRKEQLVKMKAGIDKTALENELKAAETMMQRMKEKYKFEHVQSYETFTKV